MFNQANAAVAAQLDAARQQGYVGSIQGSPAPQQTIQGEVELLVKRLISARDNIVSLRNELIGLLPTGPDHPVPSAPNCVLTQLSAANNLLAEIEGELMAISARF